MKFKEYLLERIRETQQEIIEVSDNACYDTEGFEALNNTSLEVLKARLDVYNEINNLMIKRKRY